MTKKKNLYKKIPHVDTESLQQLTSSIAHILFLFIIVLYLFPNSSFSPQFPQGLVLLAANRDQQQRPDEEERD